MAFEVLIECPADDGEPSCKAPAVVRVAGGHGRAGDVGVRSRLGRDLETRLRRRAPRVTPQPETPDQQSAAGNEPAPSPPAGEPEAPVGPPPPTIPLEPSGEPESPPVPEPPPAAAERDAPPPVEPPATAPVGPAAAPPVPAAPAPAPPLAPAAPAPPPAEAPPPLGAPLAAADGSAAGGLGHDRPEVLAGAAFAGGFLVALILKRLAG